MSKERVLEIVKKSAKFSAPPCSTLELVALSFLETTDANLVRPLILESIDLFKSLASSSYFGISKAPSKPREVIDTFGVKKLRNVLLLKWLLAFEKAGKYDRLDYAHLKLKWFLTAGFAADLAEMLRLGDADEVFCQAMLQDISLLALARAVPEVYFVIGKLDPNSNKSEQLEQKKMQMSHAELSASMLNSWGFPEEFQIPVAIHHKVANDASYQATKRRQSCLILFAAQLAESLLLDPHATSYGKLESRFQRWLDGNPSSLPGFIRTSIDKLRDLGEKFGLSELQHLSSIRLLKQNRELLQRRLIPYDDLLEELIVAHDRIDLLERAKAISIAAKERHTLRDELTGLYTKGYFLETLINSIAAAKRYAYPLGIMMLGIDKFTKFNDNLGHESGNSILEELGQLLLSSLRQSDTIARIGSDEFCVILPYAGRIQANFVAERTRRLIESYSFEDPLVDRQHQMTISLGFSYYIPQKLPAADSDLLSLAKRSLDSARARGGNRVVGA